MICFILGWVHEDSSFYSAFTNVNANGLFWAISAIPALPSHILIFIPVLPSHILIFLCVFTQDVDACLLIILYSGMGGEVLWNDLPSMPGHRHLSPEIPWGSALADQLSPLFQALWGCPVPWLPVLYFVSQHTSNCSAFRCWWKQNFPLMAFLYWYVYWHGFISFKWFYRGSRRVSRLI